MIFSSREVWARVLMNEFLFFAHPDRHAPEETTGQPQLFLCPLVTLCSHRMQPPPPHFLIWIFISGTELQLSAGLSISTPLHPSLHCMAAPAPGSTVSCGHFLAATGLWAGFSEFLPHLSESHWVSDCKGSRNSLHEPSPALLCCPSYSLSIDTHWASTPVRQDARC